MSVNVSPGIVIRISVTSDTAGLASRNYVDEKTAALEKQMVKTINGAEPDEYGNVDVREMILDFMIELGAAPVMLDEDGSALADGDGAILINDQEGE